MKSCQHEMRVRDLEEHPAATMTGCAQGRWDIRKGSWGALLRQVGSSRKTGVFRDGLHAITAG
jgi:hypothetical protein